MSVALKAAIRDLLLGDAQFLADMAALGLQTTGAAAAPAKVLKGFRPLAAIGQENYPCWVLESGDDALAEESIGAQYALYESEVLLAVVWHQQDYAAAVDQRDGLLQVLVNLFQRNPAPAGCGIRVTARGNDRSATHPTHVATFRLMADVEIHR